MHVAARCRMLADTICCANFVVAILYFSLHTLDFFGLCSLYAVCIVFINVTILCMTSTCILIHNGSLANLNCIFLVDDLELKNFVSANWKSYIHGRPDWIFGLANIQSNFCCCRKSNNHVIAFKGILSLESLRLWLDPIMSNPSESQNTTSNGSTVLEIGPSWPGFSQIKHLVVL